MELQILQSLNEIVQYSGKGYGETYFKISDYDSIQFKRGYSRTFGK
jgi:hypothetical protein